jgi:hypothetical protein
MKFIVRHLLDGSIRETLVGLERVNDRCHEFGGKAHAVSLNRSSCVGAAHFTGKADLAMVPAKLGSVCDNQPLSAYDMQTNIKSSAPASGCKPELANVSRAEGCP